MAFDFIAAAAARIASFAYTVDAVLGQGRTSD
jgi:hypothetical protein